MNELIQRLNHLADTCDCGHVHAKIEMTVHVQKNALEQARDFLVKKGIHSICLAADEHTYEAAGKTLHDKLTDAGLEVSLCLFKPNAQGDVLADADAVFQLLLATKEETGLLLAVGSGTIHDIVRFVSSRVGKPFVSIPTAASVDGFTSGGAPLMIDGVKQTIQTVAPIALFADLDVLMKAPRELTAAGFGDMLGKLTSLADWQISRDLGGEPFCETAYEITESALKQCIQHVDEIAARSEKGLTFLITALIESGLSMLSLGHSRPASGGEHHISHRWEMTSVEHQQRQMLHGAQVGVASAMLADCYRQLAEQEQDQSAFAVYKTLPTGEQMRAWLTRCGGPATTEELGIPAKWLTETLQTAPDLRNRYTGLRYIRDHYPEWLKANT